MALLSAQPIVLTAVTFAARVRLAEPGLTPIERVALQAIGLGVDDVRVLTSLLGLGARPTFDLLHDLWRAGHVLVATGKGRVELAGRARRLFGEGRLEELASAERKVEAVDLVQELLTGGVLPPAGAWRPEGPDSALLPTPMAGLDLAGLQRGAMEDALHRALERRARRQRASLPGERPLQIQEVWLDPEQLIQAPTHEAPGVQSRRYLNLLADVWMDADARRLRFSLVHAPDVPPTLARGLERALSDRSELDADLLFYKRLREALERKPEVASPARRAGALDELARAVGRLDRVDAGTVAQRQEELCERYEGARDELADAARHQARAELLAGYAALDEAIKGLARRATRQLVLANPWITLDGLLDEGRGESWFSLLDGALRQGVRVVLLWGIREDSELPRDVRTALEDLGQRHPGLCLASSRSATLHAKVAVADTSEAIVTSYNYLAPPRAGDSLELGLHVRGRAEGEHPAAVLALLGWARERFPEYHARQAIETQPTQSIDLARDLNLPISPGLPELPEGPDRLEDRALALRLWVEEWQGLARHLRQQAEGLGAGARLVKDGEHRERLWEALRGARRRLVVSSDKLAVDVVNDRFARAVQDRVRSGVPCAFLYRNEGISDSAEGPAARLGAIAAASPELCGVLAARSHAKLLVHDDELVLGSYNFLSFGAEQGGGRGRLERAELSLSVEDGALVDLALDALDAQSPGAFAHLRGRAEGGGDGLTGALPPSMQGLLRALNQTQTPPEALKDWFSRSTAPWTELDALRRAEAAPALLERALLGALAFSEDRTEARVRWQGQAALLRWQAADLLGAAVLLPHAEDGVLPRWLAELGAAVQAEAPTVPAAGAPRNEDEATAAAALLVAHALTTGDYGSLDRWDPAPHALPGVTRSWMAGLRPWRQAAHGAALPLALLRRHADQDIRHRELEAARASLGRALVDAMHVGFLFPLGQHTWELLKQEGRLLGELEAACRLNEPQRLSRYLADLARVGKGPEQLMDEASLERRDEHNVRIAEPKRRSCVKRLQRAWDAAQSWVALWAEDAPTPEDHRLLEAARVLRRDLDGLASWEPDPLGLLAPAALQVARALLRPLLALEVR